MKIMTYEQETSEKFAQAKKLTQEITDFLNNFSYGTTSQLFNEAMSREHRTLQQNFMRLVCQYIEFCASEDYRTDGRNEQSKELAKTLLKLYVKYIKDTYGYDTDKISSSLGTI
jgi:hypothetical protein